MNEANGNRSTVETGWIEAPLTPYNDVSPHLFMAMSDCGVYKNGGYVGISGIPWVQTSSSVYPNQVVTHDDRVHEYAVWRDSSNNWHFYYDGQWVGYIPHSAWTCRFPKNVNLLNFGGEVATPEYETCTDMGNGTSGPNAADHEYTFWINEYFAEPGELHRRHHPVRSAVRAGLLARRQWTYMGLPIWWYGMVLNTRRATGLFLAIALISGSSLVRAAGAATPPLPLDRLTVAPTSGHALKVRVIANSDPGVSFKALGVVTASARVLEGRRSFAYGEDASMSVSQSNTVVRLLVRPDHRANGALLRSHSLRVVVSVRIKQENGVVVHAFKRIQVGSR